MLERYKKYIAVAGILVAAVWIFTFVFVTVYKRGAAVRQSVPTRLSTMATATSEEVATFPTETFPTAPSTAPTAINRGETLSVDGNNVTVSARYTQPSWVVESSSAKESSSIADSSSRAEASSIARSEKESKEAAEATRVNPPEGKAKIVKTYVNAINKLKSTGDFTVTKRNNIRFEIDNVTGGSYVRNIVRKIANRADNSPKTYNFKNGNDSASGLSPMKVIAPDGILCSLSDSDVKSATCEKGSNGSFTIKMNLKDAHRSITRDAKGYATSVDVLTVEALGLPSSMIVESMDLDYTNGVIEAKIDSGGRILSLTHSFDVKNGVGKGKITLVTVNLEMHGSNTQTYKMSYSD